VWGLLLSLMLAAPEPATASPAAPNALTIEDAIARALERNERAEIAGEEQKAAQARLWKARAFFFPEITSRADLTLRDHETTRDVAGDSVVIQSRSGVQTTSVASLTLFDARAFPLWRAARKNRDAAVMEAADARRGIAFETADAFLSVLGVQQVREAAERRLSLSQQALSDAKARFDAKLVGVNDVTRAELELAIATRELAQARGEVDLAKLELGFLLGGEAPGSLARPDAILSRAFAAPGSVAELAERAVTRPDVRAAKTRAAAARSLSAEPLARTLPTLSANATYRTTNEAGLSGREEDWWVAGTASWILFDGGERYADRREQKALARIATLQASALEREARLQLEQSRIGLLSAQAAFAAAQAEAEAARRNERETSALYEQGLASALEASTARVSLFEAEVVLVREEYGLASAYLAIPDALGQDPFGRDVASEASR